MDAVTLPGILVAVVTVVSPLLTSLFTHTQMSSKSKNAVAFMVSAAIAVGYEAWIGGFAGDWVSALPQAVAVVYGVQQLVYNAILKNLATVVEAKYGVVDKQGKHEAGVVAEQQKAADGSEVVVATPVEETPAKG